MPFGDDKGAACGIAIGDLDEDSWPDIVVARSGAPSVAYQLRRPALSEVKGWPPMT